jgi:Zn finger protein HypA/HybF involved in hydrogenase expression
MHDFSLVSNNIKSFSESEKEYTIKTILCVKFYDYVVDNEGKVIRGLKNRRIQMNYELTFVKSKSNKANKCPNCNAPLDSVSSSICPYCRSTIVSDYHDFVLSKKEVINQFLE